MAWRGRIIGLVVLMMLPCAAHSAPPALPPLPISAFYTAPVVRGAQLSPGGGYVAMIERLGPGESITVLDVASGRKTAALKPSPGQGVDWVRWKDNDRLVAGLSAADGGRLDGDDAPGELPAGQTVAAIDRDGSKAVILAGRKRGKALDAVRVADTLSGDPRHVLVEAPDAKGAPALWKVDVHSGQAEFVQAGADDADERIPPAAMIVRYDVKASDATGDFDVLGPADGPRRAYVALQPSGPKDGDTASLRIYDFKKKVFSDPLWPALKYDVSDVVYHAGDMGLAGVCYTADAYTCEFKDKALQADYARAIEVFHGQRALTPLSMSEDGHEWLFAVSGPDEPGAYYLFDRQTAKMTRVAERFPGLPSARLATMERYDYEARDGFKVPAFLTTPPNAPAGPLPLIVMPHGGPEARDSFAFDIWTQVLATRGYMVLQPNFRGSSGYGRAFAEAGYGQWGAKMQDDLTDGVKKLIAEGRVDPKRVCIFGASYGGYAALYGGARQPELYKCAASFAGVSDLKALVAWEKATPGHQPRYRYAEEAIGDPVKDAARLKAASPITYADTYGPPVLLIHGTRDESVPVEQSRAMERALRKAHRSVKLLTFDEGHAGWDEKTEQVALGAIADFMQKHIAPAIPAS